MKPITAGLALAFAALVLSTSSANAQKTLSLGVSGGLSVPTGQFADFQASGFHVGGHLNLAPASLPIQILVDGTYHSFDGNLDLATPISVSYFGVAGNVAYVFPGASMRPYLMGGVGMYFGKADVPGAESESEFGFNAGGGLRFVLSGLSTFLQVRANFVGDNTFIPISFGILF